MCTQVSSQQKIKKIIPQNFFHLSPVSLTPVINIHSRLSPRIFEKIRNGPNGIHSGARGTLIYEKKPEVEILVSDSLLSKTTLVNSKKLFFPTPGFFRS